MKLYKYFVVVGVVVIATLTFFYRYSIVDKKTIAVLVAHGLSAHEKMYEGFMEAAACSTYKKSLNIVPYWFDVEDQLKVSAVCESVLAAKPDVIIAGGGVCLQTLYEVMQKRKSTIPTVFMGVNSAVELGIIDSFERPGGVITGAVFRWVSHAAIESKLVLLTKPAVKRVMIPCNVLNDANGDVMRSALNIQSYLAGHNIVADIIPLNGLSNALSLIKSFLSAHDMIVVLELDSSVQLSAGIAKLCEAAGVTFFCSAFDGVAAGAAITYATNTAYLGIEGFKAAIHILFHGGNPAEMPVVSLENTRDLFINTKTALMQGYHPDITQMHKDLGADSELAWLQGRIKVIS